MTEELKPTNLEVTWLSDTPGKLENVFVGVLQDPKDVAVGIVEEEPHAGVLIAFSGQGTALLFKGEAATALLKGIDILLHDAVEFSEEGPISEGFGSPDKKVTLH